MHLFRSLRRPALLLILMTPAIALVLFLAARLSGIDPVHLSPILNGAVQILLAVVLAMVAAILCLRLGRIARWVGLAGLIVVAGINLARVPTANERHRHPVELSTGKSLPGLIDTYRIRTAGLGMRHILLLSGFLPGETQITRLHLLAPLDPYSPRITEMASRLADEVIPADRRPDGGVRLSAEQQGALGQRLRIISGGNAARSPANPEMYQAPRIRMGEDLIDDSRVGTPVEACLLASGHEIYIVSEHDPDCGPHLARQGTQ